ncbi:GDSL-type esterase/lipase family protein [Paenibacillus polymyxa]|uniref:GDSL-type esterase/lipase family protein n=1 Tax=Paenibacillus polymyxa TaxID=1406 RepID=UPI002AB5AE48|nr:GDSL-type esterase/lipase family protein [Paenibacillus polymyxa]MDY8025493.1 GDSL-type esterase/lipase family protein [Paenibacillus polymyxa]
MRTQFEMDEEIKTRFLAFAMNKAPAHSLKPERFMNKMLMNKGTLGAFSPDGLDEKGLERRNPVIAVLGDSVTAGHFEWTIDPAELFKGIGEGPSGPLEITDAREVYHERFRLKLIDKYEETSVSVINAGIAGDDISGMERRLSRDIINCQPDLVLINGSLNWPADISLLSVFEETLRRMVKRIQAETEADIILMTPNAEGPSLFNPNGSTLRERVEIIRRVAAEEGTCLSDTYAVWADFLEMGYDVTQLLANKINHPSKAGHEVYAIELMKLFE